MQSQKPPIARPCFVDTRKPIFLSRPQVWQKSIFLMLMWYSMMPLFITDKLKNMAYYKLTGMSQGEFIPIELHPVAN
jgi:hypothetical protein